MEFEEVDLKRAQEILENPTATLVDIREVWEYHDFNIGGINIPAHMINEHIHKLDAFTDLIIACSNGTRSYILTRIFKKKLPEKNVYHLEGGIF
ncbi:rhodanese-like domain-containing protein [Jiulongibacter sp. NS-SX5]|uniref:rhodanese-like domain-containing protein n=1 Tax=Jiulongibacter sp. NS-SX5 TaxID=3463854 RepID=UPI004058614D